MASWGEGNDNPVRRVCAMALLVVGGLGVAGVGVAAGMAKRVHAPRQVLTAAPAPMGEVTSVPLPTPDPVPEERPPERPSRASAPARSVAPPAPVPRRGLLPWTVTIRSVTASGTMSATGIILDGAGHVLTSSHVVDGARAIRVQVSGSGPTYAAGVVGRDVSDDIAVLQLQNASNLQPAVLGRSSTVSIGQPVAVVGNAVGRGLVAVPGLVTATGQTITGEAGDGRTQVLHGLIEIEAPVVKGESGGPVLDRSGAVVGILSAGGSVSSRGATRGYAVPIDTAIAAANQIHAGRSDVTPAPRPQPAPPPAPASPPASSPQPEPAPPNRSLPVKFPLL